MAEKVSEELLITYLELTEKILDRLGIYHALKVNHDNSTATNREKAIDEALSSYAKYFKQLFNSITALG